MRPISLAVLRVTLGGLMGWWGLDKLLDPTHGVKVSQTFYGDLLTGADLIRGFGVAQVLLGLLLIAGLWRRTTYPALLLVTGTTLLAVWKSVLDPFHLLVDGGALIFYPSVIIVAAAVVLLAFREEDRLALDARRA